MQINNDRIDPVIDPQKEREEPAESEDQVAHLVSLSNTEDAENTKAEELEIDGDHEVKANKKLQALIILGGALFLIGSAYYMWINAPWVEAKARKNQIVVHDPKASATPLPDDSTDVRKLLDQLKESESNPPTPQGEQVSVSSGALRSVASAPSIPAAFWSSGLPTTNNSSNQPTGGLNEGPATQPAPQPTRQSQPNSAEAASKGESPTGAYGNAGTVAMRGSGEQTRSIRVVEDRRENPTATTPTPRQNPSPQTAAQSQPLPFGAQLPVRLVGQISSLNANVPVRLELVDDYFADNLHLKRGTQFIAQMNNAFAGRIQARVIGYIAKSTDGTEHLVPIEGQVLGNDAAPGLIGVERVIRTNKRSALSSALGRVGQVGLNAARSALYALGVGGQLGAQAIDSVAAPELYIYQDSNGYFRYVEVPAGVFGYVLVTAIPQPAAP